jgi:two-component system response regulator RegA
MKVLIVEDDLDFRETLKSEFEDRGGSVYTCLSLNELGGLPSDITDAIVDLRLKKLSGLDFISPIRSRFPNINIVMLTAYGSIATSVQAIKLGADNYIMKPCSFDEILQALKSPVVSDDESDVSEPTVPGLYQKEREYIEYVLTLCDGNITKAAEHLGIRRQSLQRKLKKYPQFK